MIKEIEERLEAAAPNGQRWEIKTNRHRECSGEAWGWVEGPCENWCWTDKRPSSRKDAEFIANAPVDMRYLLSEVKRLTAENEQLTKQLYAAVEDMTKIANSVGYIGQCKYCAKDRQECDVFDLPCDFEWRGEDKQNKNTTESEG